MSYDVFISFKSTDDNGQESRDSLMAESLYFALQRKGYNPFFSKHSINNVGRSDYITLINEAIEQAKIFVAVGTSRKNLTSRWVKREISMFSALMMQAEEGALTLLTYRSPDFPVSELPVNLADLQSFADEQALIRFIDISLKNAYGFCNYGDYTQLLYDESSNDAPSGKNTCTDSQIKKIQIGDKLDDRYSVLTKIGQGGMSNVYLAVNERTGRQCAIKELRRESVLDFESMLISLRIETDMLKGLSHKAIPEIIDIIETDESYIVVMEYVCGQILQKAIEESGTMPEKDIISIGKQLAEVLNYIHTQPTPIIHRDVKPANIILKPDGDIALLDFGTARKFKNQSLSDTTCLGTIGYAAPEQYGGMGQSDCRTDIYGLGVTLYYLATGNNPALPPYEIVPVRQVKPELSEGIEYIIHKCTQKAPDARFQSATELLNAFDNIDHLNKHNKNFSKKSFVSKWKVLLRKGNEQTSVSAPQPAHTEKETIPASSPAEAPETLPDIVDSITERLKADTVILPQTPVQADRTHLFNEDILSKFSALDIGSQKLICDLIDCLYDKKT